MDLENIKVALPGSSRKESVANGFEKLARVDKVLVHDAARPLATDSLFERILAWLDLFPVVVPAIDVEDALRKKEGSSTVPFPREDLMRVQTPQGFRYEVLKAVLETSDEDVATAVQTWTMTLHIHLLKVTNRLVFLHPAKSAMTSLPMRKTPINFRVSQTE